MKIKEAIAKMEQQKLKFLENNVDYAGITEAYNMAISALEKQAGKKPDYQYEVIKKHMNKAKAPFCSVCGADLLDDANDCYEYCPECGQKIDWEVTE